MKKKHWAYHFTIFHSRYFYDIYKYIYSSYILYVFFNTASISDSRYVQWDRIWKETDGG